MGTLLLFARDPGNANQIVALHELVREAFAGTTPTDLSRAAAELVAELAKTRTETDLAVGAQGAAINVLATANIAVDEAISAILEAGDAHQLSAHDIDTVVTGLSDRDDRTPQALWRVAASCGARSVALADDTTLALGHAADDLAERFTDTNGTRVHPDLVCVVDDASSRALAATGVPEDRIRVIGNLHLRRFRLRARAVADDAVATVRADWGARNGEGIVLFASEPITQMQNFGKRRDHDELSALDGVVARIRAGTLDPALGRAEDTLVVIRPHPRDETAKFDRFRTLRAPRTVVSRAGGSTEAILAADIVVGLSSMLLVEAATLDRPSISMIDFDPRAAARGN